MGGLPGKYCIVVNYVVFEAIKIKFKPKPIFGEKGKKNIPKCHLLIFLPRQHTK